MPEPAATISLNADAARNQLMGSLRATLQHVVLGLHAVETASDGQLDLDEVFFAFHLDEPPASTRESRTQFKAWLLGIGLRDGIEALTVFIDGIRFLAGLVRRAAGKGVCVPRAGTAATVLRDLYDQETGKFVRLGLPEKLARLSTEFGIQVPLEAPVLSLQQARNCLTHRRGIVGPEDTAPSGESLHVRFVLHEIVHIDSVGDNHVIEQGTLVLAGESLAVRSAERERTFPLGHRVIFTAQEFHHLIYTLWAAGSQLVDELINYAERNGILHRKAIEPAATGGADKASA